MFIKIPFESEIEFKTNISEITKISLEHEFNVNEGAVLGNFYVSGEYRVHPVSVNTEPFNYTLPFTVEVRDDIDPNTLEFNIEDFTYEVINDNKLKVNIEYSLKGEEKVTELPEFERVDESKLDSELAYIDNFLDSEEKGEKNIEEDKKSIREDQEEVQEAKVEEVKKEEELKRDIEENKKTVMDTIKDSDDTFVTYHIHIVTEGETMENICKKYNVVSSIISEYNDNLESLTIGDKIIIPEIDE